MPISHLLDTSVYSQPMKPQPVPAVMERWEALGDDAVCTSIVCEAELLFGLELRNSARLWRLYEDSLKGRIAVFSVDEGVAKAFSTIKAACRKKGIARSDFDFLIAAAAKARGLVVGTLNARHFQGIEGVAFEDWSV